MLEIEVKSPCSDIGRVKSHLESIGASRVGTSRQVDIYFTHPLRRFAVTDEALRIRKEGDRCTLVYKGPKIDSETKTREEIEVEVSDCDLISSILKKLGFDIAGKVTKERTVYRTGALIVCLDEVEDLGSFVEIEYAGEDFEKGKGEILSLMKELRLSHNERRSYLELLLIKRSRKGE
ncbi:MAG: class IV adenylate cyclase [Methanomassiliicoccales archaeon]|jgi:adenylate cyclase class 2|nr:class IV adenylate cyclase [Methanomassiliicoccales archaeon]